MKLTLLKVVQSYLNRTDGFYVNSIFETDESLQVAEIAQEVFYDMYEMYRNSSFTLKLRKLDAVSDTSKPNYLRMPDNMQRIQESRVYYDVRDLSNSETQNYRELTYLTPVEFLDNAQKTLKTTTTNFIEITDFNGTRFPVQTNKAPQFYTSFDDEYLVFDSLNKDDDSTLQSSKSRVHSSEEPVFLLQDDYIIEIPDHLTSLYRDLVLVETYSALRQEPAPIEVQRRARTGRIRMQQDQNRIGNAGRVLINYARRPNGVSIRNQRQRENY